MNHGDSCVVKQMLRGGCLSQDDVEQLKKVLDGRAPLVMVDEKDDMSTLMALIRERIELEGANVPPVSIRGALVDRRIQEMIWDKNASKPLDYKASFCYNSHVIHTMDRYQYLAPPLSKGAEFQCKPVSIATVNQNCSYARGPRSFAAMAEEHPEYMVRLGANLGRDREVKEALEDSDGMKAELGEDLPTFGFRVPSAEELRSPTPGRTPVNFM